LKGAEGFQHYYSDIYHTRWAGLKEAMLKKRDKWLRPTNHSVSVALMQEQLFLNDSTRDLLQSTYSKDSEILKTYYAMDMASAVVADLLPIAPGAQVLDMCAAPGGKSLILTRKLQDSANLILNEMSATRRARLKNVMQEYLSEAERSCLKITGKDAIRFGVETPGYFDAILLDAPCSSEEHLLHDKIEMKKWSINRSKKLASIQYGLLCSAILALKSGGHCIYSTCSISPIENEELIQKLMDKKGASIEIKPIEFPLNLKAETLKFGYIFLPDLSGLGPMYVCSIKKKEQC
jgi:16S rRNA C967 or C1407 C5-methylase (RsmB/RsmF family)